MHLVNVSVKNVNKINSKEYSSSKSFKAAPYHSIIFTWSSQKSGSVWTLTAFGNNET